jgi:hypothetical protein
MSSFLSPIVQVFEIRFSLLFWLVLVVKLSATFLMIDVVPSLYCYQLDFGYFVEASF